MLVGGEGPEVVGPMRAAWTAALGASVPLAGTRAALGAAGIDPHGSNGSPPLVLQLPGSDDRYVRNPLGTAPWRPFGMKSGPNLQWVLAMEQAFQRTPAEWLLLLEPDAAPFGDGLASRVLETIARHPSAWVIGAHPHPSLLRRLDPDLHDHLNGVALYRIGDEAFRSFLRRVWVPSLLEALQQAPHLAFDCMTAQRLQDRLAGGLDSAWRTARHRFVASPELVNLSGPQGRPTSGTGPDPAGGAVRPWLVHSRAAAQHPCTWRR